MEQTITMENFGEYNRDRKIGNSLYRICNTKTVGKGKWYILEVYNDGTEWATNKAFYCDKLQEVIDKINSFTKEKEIISLKFK